MRRLSTRIADNWLLLTHLNEGRWRLQVFGATPLEAEVTAEDEAAAKLLKNEGILVHPGYFYDIAPDHLVTTFIDEPDRIEEHFRKIALYTRQP